MNKLNTKHLAIIIIGMATVALKTFPTVFTSNGGRDTWIVTIFAAAAIIATTLYLLWVCRKTDTYNIHRIFTGAAGKALGSVLYFLYLLMILLTMMESAGAGANVMHTSFLIKDPVWLFLLLTVLVGLYVVKKKGPSVVTTSVITLFAISASGILLSILTAKYKDFKYLSPMMENGVTGGMVTAFFQIMGALSTVALVLPYLSGLKDTKKLLFHSFWGLIFLVQIEIVSMLGAITTFGIDRLNSLIYPKLTQTQMISYFGFLEAGELFVMLQIIAGWFIQYILAFYALMQGAEMMNVKSRFLEYGASALAFAVAFFASRNLFSMFSVLPGLVIVQLVGFVALPVAVFTVFLLRRRNGQKLERREGEPAA